MRKLAFTFDWQKPIHFPVSRSPYIQCVNLCLTYRFVVLCVHFIVVILAGGVLTGIHPHPLTAVNEDAETEVGNIFYIYSAFLLKTGPKVVIRSTFLGFFCRIGVFNPCAIVNVFLKFVMDHQNSFCFEAL